MPRYVCGFRASGRRRAGEMLGTVARPLNHGDYPPVNYQKADANHAYTITRMIRLGHVYRRAHIGRVRIRGDFRGHLRRSKIQPSSVGEPDFDRRCFSRRTHGICGVRDDNSPSMNATPQLAAPRPRPRTNVVAAKFHSISNSFLSVAIPATTRTRYQYKNSGRGCQDGCNG